MKKILFPLCIFAISAGAFTSCDKDDDTNNDVTIVSSAPKRIAYMDNSVGNTVNYEFDTKGRIKGLTGQYVYGGNGMEEYDYGKLTVKGKYANNEIEGILNLDGTVAQVEGGNQILKFFYNDNMQLTIASKEQKMENFKARVTDIRLTWEDGDIVSSDYKALTRDYSSPVTNEETDIEELPTMTYKYTNGKVTSPIENKGNLMLNFYLYSDYVSFICATGEAPLHLPVAINRGTGEFEDIEYVFDKNGYPTRISFGDKVINYTWK